MIRKLKTNWQAIALTVVVIISLVLSWIIWTNPFPYEGARHENFSNSQSQQFTPQSMGDVYLPTKAIQTGKDGRQNQLFSQKANLVLSVKKQLQGWKLGRTSIVKRDNSDVYLSYLRRRNSLMLTYPDEIPSSVFNETFSQAIDTARVGQINHIVIPLNGQREIYLLSDHRYGVYQVRVSKGSTSKVKRLLAPMKKIPVDHKIINGTAVMMYPRSFELPVIGYQITSQNIDNLSASLMSTSQHTTITANRSGNETIYTDGTNKRLIYNRSIGTMKYENYLSKDDRESTSLIYPHFYTKLTKIGIPLDNIRYDSASAHGRRLTYRSYVNGFPIFNNNEYGEVTMESTSGGNERYWMSLYSLQVPLPINHQNVKLPSSTEVINQLHATNRLKDVNNLRLGYAWKTENKNHRTVKLVPTYFVKYRGHWVEYTYLEK
ncbi:YycH family regulatory protein [Limosilactobacillus caccae]|uniref:YycH family regulatory protein n=1 Tax=Limosilactobacillus caccae TaxID=1926284 RepID=UPI000970D74B|nr:two-component system activity regulator YycH [Limosilactobacillus caccae]